MFQDLTGEASLTDVERTIQKAYQDAGKPADERDARIEEIAPDYFKQRRFIRSASAPATTRVA